MGKETGLKQEKIQGKSIVKVFKELISLFLFSLVLHIFPNL